MDTLTKNDQAPREISPVEHFLVELRKDVKRVAATVDAARREPHLDFAKDSDIGEARANIALAYRHLEDASMRLGKAIQAVNGGASVYDRSTTVGA